MQSNSELSKKDEQSVADLLEYNRSNNWPDVSPQHKVLVHEYSICGDLGAAAKAANMSRPLASRTLRDNLVRSYLDDIHADSRQDSIITRQFVELQYLEYLDQVNGDVEVPVVTRDGDVIMAKKFDSTGKLGALRDMAKFSGMEKNVGSSSGGVVVQFDFSAFGVQREVGVTIENGSDSPTE